MAIPRQSSLLFASTTASICDLLCCHFSRMSRLTPDFELIGDVTMAETSFLLGTIAKLRS